jgi:hypothetical protein
MNPLSDNPSDEPFGLTPEGFFPQSVTALPPPSSLAREMGRVAYDQSVFSGSNIRAFVMTGSEFQNGVANRVLDLAKNGSLAASSAYQALKQLALPPTYLLADLTSITVSTYRSKQQVRTLGRVNPVGLAYGQRTIAGTMILTEFDREPFWRLLQSSLADRDIMTQGYNAAVLLDQLPPFNIMLFCANEYGDAAYRVIYEISVVTNGTVYSIQDMYTENTISFMATDVTALQPLSVDAGTPGMSVLASAMSATEIARRFRDLKGARANLY